MATNKINKAKVLELIKEEAYIITRKKELYDEVKKIEDELKHINESMGLTGQGLCGTMGFANPNDALKKSHSGFVNSMNISHIAQLATDMGIENPYDSKEAQGFGDEFNIKNSDGDESLKKENELLKQEIELLRNKQ